MFIVTDVTNTNTNTIYTTNSIYTTNNANANVMLILI